MPQYRYKGPAGKHTQLETKKSTVPNQPDETTSKTLNPGDVVELSKEQAAAFADRFEAVDRSEHVDRPSGPDPVWSASGPKHPDPFQREPNTKETSGETPVVSQQQARGGNVREQPVRGGSPSSDESTRKDRDDKTTREQHGNRRDHERK